MQEHIPAHYSSYPLRNIKDFPNLCEKHSFSGLNVTYPYKEHIIHYLDTLDPVAATIGAVNVIHFHRNQRIGYNTDAAGFRSSILPYLTPMHSSALILGTGGAAKAVNFALHSLGLQTTFVSRQPETSLQHLQKQQKCIGYSDLNEDIVRRNLLIVNCTPLGMIPDVAEYPHIPYSALTDKHLLYDVIYNPAETLFLRLGREHGCLTANGLQMLYGQAMAAWDIWKNDCLASIDE
ncbi:MAG TPA: shikimate dehydrogenase [Bacteroidales bacterium]|nr:shikimate dehydrogenase [Bacteroidales bacterium]